LVEAIKKIHGAKAKVETTADAARRSVGNLVVRISTIGAANLDTDAVARTVVAYNHASRQGASPWTVGAYLFPASDLVDEDARDEWNSALERDADSFKSTYGVDLDHAKSIVPQFTPPTGELALMLVMQNVPTSLDDAMRSSIDCAASMWNLLTTMSVAGISNSDFHAANVRIAGETSYLVDIDAQYASIQTSDQLPNGWRELYVLNTLIFLTLLTVDFSRRGLRAAMLDAPQPHDPGDLAPQIRIGRRQQFAALAREALRACEALPPSRRSPVEAILADDWVGGMPEMWPPNAEPTDDSLALWAARHIVREAVAISSMRRVSSAWHARQASIWSDAAEILGKPEESELTHVDVARLNVTPDMAAAFKEADAVLSQVYMTSLQKPIYACTRTRQTTLGRLLVEIVYDHDVPLHNPSSIAARVPRADGNRIHPPRELFQPQ
jgi:hypothetical protein